MLSQVRLLLNTRDELALAINCSLPGTELTQAAFADIKAEAQSKNMPMFQVGTERDGKQFLPDVFSPI